MMNDSSYSRTLSSPVLGLLWFGASVSLAEILTGTFFAPLGFQTGLAAILLGHAIGGVLFFAVSSIGAREGKSAMETVKISFGKYGSIIFSVANVVQLIGWTAIMIVSAAISAAYLAPMIGTAGWTLVVGVLIVAWIAVGTKNMGRIQAISALALFALTVVVSVVVFGDAGVVGSAGGESLSFGAAVELAVAMPLSWLPVASDYMRSAKRPLKGAVAGSVAYFIGSCWMYLIGMGLALFAQADDVASVLAQAGLGSIGLVVVVLSTVTTTFLDAESAGVSAAAIHARIPARATGIVAAVVGTILALAFPVADFEGFLYMIGSVFAPMAAILCVDYFVFHSDSTQVSVNWVNVVLWAVGFVAYRASMGWDFVLGNTLPVMVFTAVCCVVVHTVLGQVKRRSAHAKDAS